jgi:hypothetical protein
MNEEARSCIQTCLDCHRACLEAVAHLQTDALGVDPAHIRLLFSCAELCHTNANLLRSGHDVSWRGCAPCADVCERSAAYCDGLAEDPVMRRCADACRRCAAACQRVVAALAA